MQYMDMAVPAVLVDDRAVLGARRTVIVHVAAHAERSRETIDFLPIRDVAGAKLYGVGSTAPVGDVSEPTPSCSEATRKFVRMAASCQRSMRPRTRRLASVSLSPENSPIVDRPHVGLHIQRVTLPQRRNARVTARRRAANIAAFVGARCKHVGVVKSAGRKPRDENIHGPARIPTLS